MLLKAFILVFGISLSAISFADSADKPEWVEPRFGPEFTFSCTPTLSNKILMQALNERCFIHLVENQPVGQKFVVDSENGYFVSPNGWSFLVGADMGVSEVKMTPNTVEYFKHYESDIQDAIFASAATEGMYPFLFLGGGHINMSWDVFENNLRLLRNFLVDFYNHNELAMGVFGYDTHNALPIQLKFEYKKLIQQLIEEIDSKKIATVDGVVFKLAAHLELMIKDVFYQKWRGSVLYRPFRFHSIAFRDLLDPKQSGRARIEIRSVRPQASMNVFIRQISLLRNRLRYLYELKENLQVEPKVKIQTIDVAHHYLNPPVDPQDALRAFYQYVRESGERWSDHRDYLWPNWIQTGEVAKFEQSLNLCAESL